MVKPLIRAVVFREGEWWIVQGLDYDFATATRRLEDIPGEIQRWITVLLAANKEMGVEAFHGYSTAPRKYWRMYEQADARTERLTIELPQDLGSAPVVDTRLAA